MEILKQNKGYAWIIASFAFLLFSNTIGHDFAWDDKIVIQENERVQAGISGIPELFKKYSSELRQDKYGYRPITLTTFAIEYSLFGENPAGFHFMNVIYFSLLCLVIFIFLARVFAHINPLLPFLITMIFAAHPIHVEVVANIKSRDEILALLFGLLSVIYFLKAFRSTRFLPAIWGGIFFLLAFLSRENAVTFLAVIPLALFIQPNFNKQFFFKLSALLPVIGAVVIALLYYTSTSKLGLEKTSGMGVVQEFHGLGNAFFVTGSFGAQIGNALHLVVLYVGKFVLPYPLTYYSGYNTIQVWGFLGHLLAGLFFIGVFVFLPLRYFRKKPVLVFGLLFFLLTLSVYLQLFNALSDTMADRFLFAPSLGLCIVAGSGLYWLIQKGGAVTSNLKELTTPLRVGIAGILVIFSVMTFMRNRVWADDMTLVSTDIEHLDNCARAHYYYASELNKQLQEEGWNAASEAQMIEHYRRSMEISDSIYYGRLELATYFLNQQEFDEGVPILEEMIQLFPKASDPYYFLGQARVDQERFAEAVPLLEKCLKLAPNSHDAIFMLAIAYGKTGKFKEGIALAQKGLKVYPKVAGNMYEALGHIYFDMGDMPASDLATFKSLEYGRDPYTVYATVIGRYQSIGDSVNALRYYQTAITKGIMQPVAGN